MALFKGECLRLANVLAQPHGSDTIELEYLIAAGLGLSPAPGLPEHATFM